MKHVTFFVGIFMKVVIACVEDRVISRQVAIVKSESVSGRLFTLELVLKSKLYVYIAINQQLYLNYERKSSIK